MKEGVSLSENNNIHLTFPTGLVLKLDAGDFTLLTDYSEERGGNNLAINPWRVFLSSIIACQGVNLAKYCRAKGIDYSKVSIDLIPFVEDTARDEFPEYHLKVRLPEEFPQEVIQEMVDSFTNCPVVNHLTVLKPIFKTYINGQLMKTRARK